MSAPVVAPDLDALLGPASERYFGSGHRDTVRELTSIVDEGGRTRAVGALDHPGRWSVKGRTDLDPHLSTVDAIHFATALTEIRLRADGMPPARVASTRARRIRIRAGREPVERGALRTVPLDAALAVQDGPPRPGVREVRCGIGPMRAVLTVATPHASPTGPVPPVPGGRVRLPSGTGLQHEVEHVRIAADGTSARARLRSTADPLPGPLLGSAHRPAGLVAAFVVALQLGQAMLYRLDDCTRADSATLWMRTAEVIVAEPDDPGGTHAEARLDRPLLLPGRRPWRTATVNATVAGATVRCAVAHELPGGTA